MGHKNISTGNAKKFSKQEKSRMWAKSCEFCWEFHIRIKNKPNYPLCTFLILAVHEDL